jgi:hypothetical protein
MNGNSNPLKRKELSDNNHPACDCEGKLIVQGRMRGQVQTCCFQCLPSLTPPHFDDIGFLSARVDPHAS